MRERGSPPPRHRLRRWLTQVVIITLNPPADNYCSHTGTPLPVKRNSTPILASIKPGEKIKVRVRATQTQLAPQPPKSDHRSASYQRFAPIHPALGLTLKQTADVRRPEPRPAAELPILPRIPANSSSLMARCTPGGPPLFFRSKLVILRWSDLIAEQHWRPSGIGLAF